jgi:hypothetical protein
MIFSFLQEFQEEPIRVYHLDKGLVVRCDDHVVLTHLASVLVKHFVPQKQTGIFDKHKKAFCNHGIRMLWPGNTVSSYTDPRGAVVVNIYAFHTIRLDCLKRYLQGVLATFNSKGIEYESIVGDQYLISSFTRLRQEKLQLFARGTPFGQPFYDNVFMKSAKKGKTKGNRKAIACFDDPKYRVEDDTSTFTEWTNDISDEEDDLDVGENDDNTPSPQVAAAVDDLDDDDDFIPNQPSTSRTTGRKRAAGGFCATKAPKIRKK